MRTHTENMTRVRVRDLYIDEAHTMLDIFRFAVFVHRIDESLTLQVKVYWILHMPGGLSDLKNLLRF